MQLSRPFRSEREIRPHQQKRQDRTHVHMSPPTAPPWLGVETPSRPSPGWHWGAKRRLGRPWAPGETGGQEAVGSVLPAGELSGGRCILQSLLLLVPMDFEGQLLSWDQSPRFRVEGNQGEASGLPLGRGLPRGRSGVLSERHAWSGCTV